MNSGEKMKIRAVIFDLDDTLYREYDFVAQSFQNVAKAMSAHLIREERIRGNETTPEEITPEALFQRMIERMEEKGRGDIFNWLCEKYHITIPPQEFVKIYRQTKPVLELYPDSEEFLRWLKEKGIKTGLITDGNSQVQHNKIEALELEKKLDVVLATDDLGLNKPAPAVYEYCLERLSCKPEQAVYVGDNPQKDFIGARGLGMETVRIVREEGLHIHRVAEEGYEADRRVRLLTEMENWGIFFSGNEESHERK